MQSVILAVTKAVARLIKFLLFAISTRLVIETDLNLSIAEVHVSSRASLAPSLNLRPRDPPEDNYTSINHAVYFWIISK